MPLFRPDSWYDLNVVSRYLGVALAAITILASTDALAGVFGSQYAASGRCAGFARADVKTLPGQCLAIVAGPQQGLRWPRGLVQQSPDTFYLTDVVDWHARGQGRVLKLTVGGSTGPRIETVVSGRNLPHGLAIGPDRKVYIGDDDAIWRFSPASPKETLERVLGGLPGKPSRGGDHQHPLKHILFDRQGNLLVNMGAPDDSCETAPGGKPHPTPCPWGEGKSPDASIWRLQMEWPSGKPGAFQPIARGLRNSIAIAVHPRTGLILQGENSIDRLGQRTDPDNPPDELNVIREGLHYGWPYCVGRGSPIPEYRSAGVNCRNYEVPAVLLPAHSAPMGLVYHSGRMHPQLADKLLVALHGFARNGHRIVAFDVDATGKPLAPPGDGTHPGFPTVVVDNWTHRRGVRPTGRPMSLVEATDGAVWFIDDKAATVLALLRDDGGVPSRQPEPNTAEAAPARSPATSVPPPGWVGLYYEVLRPLCQGCHETFVKENAIAAWNELTQEGLIDSDDIAGSPMFRAMLGKGPGRAMPLPGGLAQHPADLARLNQFLANLRRR